MSRKKFHTRSFISFALFIAIFWLLVSGTVLYIAPPGRVAHWQHWTIFGFDKNQWQAQHTLFSYLFVILAIFHIFTLNWKNFWSYVKLKSRSGFRKSREFAVALIVMMLFFFGTMMGIPPFSSFFDLGEEIGFSWEEQQRRGPIPHTENLTLEEICEKYLEIPSEEAVEKLESNGIMNVKPNQTLSEIALENAASPARLYALLSPEHQPEIYGQGSGRGSGRGFGRMTLSDVAVELNMDSDQIIALLGQNNIKARKSETIRDIASRHQMHPSEIMALIRGGE